MENIKIFLLKTLTIILFAFALHLIFRPFYGEVIFYTNKFFNIKSSLSVTSIEENIKKDILETPQNSSSTSDTDLDKKYTTSTLYIPSIDMATDIKELERLEDLHTGSWRIPESSVPGVVGNTVIVAHRYTDKGGRAENTFYNLPKVEIGEQMYVFWKNKKYTYEVYDIKVVEPTDISVEAATSTASILTLYTCTPLWSSTHRHVVFSKLVKETSI